MSVVRPGPENEIREMPSMELLRWVGLLALAALVFGALGYSGVLETSRLGGTLSMAAGLLALVSVAAALPGLAELVARKGEKSPRYRAIRERTMRYYPSRYRDFYPAAGLITFLLIASWMPVAILLGVAVMALLVGLTIREEWRWRAER